MSSKHTSKGSEPRIVVFARHDKSLWSELYSSNSNVRLLCQFFVFTVMLSVLTTIVIDTIEADRFRWKAAEFLNKFTVQGLLQSIFVFLSLHIAGLLVWPLFQLWTSLRRSAQSFRTGVDVAFGFLYLAVVILSFIYILWVCPRLQVPQLVIIVLSVEQIRLCMKSYSYVRENAYKILCPWHKDDATGPAVWYCGQMSPSVGSFKQYCHFLFVPTLLYRDHYPRSPGPFKLKPLLKYMCLFLFTVLVLVQLFGSLQVDRFNWRSVLVSLLKGLPVGFMYSLMMNLTFAHSWLNIGAEITRFGDRKFYEDWWQSYTYPEYYRKWNIIPYHFNHQYIYGDIRKATGSKNLALLVMLFSSSLIHEYVLGISFGHATPLLTIFFAGIGTFVFIVKYKGSMAMLSSLSVGLYLLFWNLSLENQARRVCPREETFIDIFYPRIFECIAKHGF